MSEKHELMIIVPLSETELEDFNRFCDTCEDFEAGGYDVPVERMKRLGKIGLVRTCGFNRYETTEVGDIIRGMQE